MEEVKLYIENRIEEKTNREDRKENRLKRLVFLKVEEMGNYNVANKNNNRFAKLA